MYETKEQDTFPWPYYLKFHYIPGTEMAKYYPNPVYYCAHRTVESAKQHLEDAKERAEDVVYEQKIYTGAELRRKAT